MFVPMKRAFGFGFMIAISLFCAVEAFSSTVISPFAQGVIDSFMTVRMNLSLSSSNEEALLKIDAFENERRSDIDSKCTEEEKIILSNFFLLERYNYLRDDASNTESLKKQFSAQNDVIQSWFSSHKNETPNRWLYVTAGDVVSVCMSFDPVRMALKYGVTVKMYYEEALAQDNNMSYALTNLAQWYWYAPGITGGSKKTARELFKKALDSAHTDAERYFALVFMSQVAFDEKNKTLAADYLSQADSYAPGGSYVASVKSMNEAGYSLFTSHSRKAN